MSPQPKQCEVWNVTLGYVEHTGSFASCVRWIENVHGLFGSGDVYQIRERTKRGR